MSCIPNRALFKPIDGIAEQFLPAGRKKLRPLKRKLATTTEGEAMLNATYLFEKPSRDLKNSESRWTAIAQISLIYMPKHIVDPKLPVYVSDEDGYLDQIDLLDVTGFNCDNTICEQGLTGPMFGIDDFDIKYHRIDPDISHFRPGKKKGKGGRG
jgi:hypothetical protein